jgi:hypothetical protein
MHLQSAGPIFLSVYVLGAGLGTASTKFATHR